MNLNIKEQEELLKSLSEEERELALQILKEYGEEGTSKTYDDLLYADFEEIPVDIHTFLHDRRYLGNALYDSDGRFTLFPFWEDTLKKIFPTNTETAYNTLILTGAIGIGKSTIAVLCQLYLLYRLLCLKDPYLYYGMQPIDKISISLMNITLENAKGVAYDKLMQMILTSEWFLQHGEVRGTTNLTYEPNKHIELITASSNNQVIGRALFCLDGDVIVKTENGDFKLKDLVDKEIKVYTLNENKEVVLSDTCSVKPTIKTNEEYQIELENSTTIKCTGNHRLMLTDGSYKRADELTEDDELYGCSYDNFINSIRKVILEEEKQYYDVVEANPYNNFLIKTNTGYVVSHNCNFSDEVNWSTVRDPIKVKEKYMKLISQIDARMKSRFMRQRGNNTYLPTLNIIASSKDIEQAFLESYINLKKKNESKTTLIIDEPQWVVDSRKDSEIKFYVAIGNKFLANELIPLNATKQEIDLYRARGYSILPVPIGYLENFRDNLDEAICSIAGISTASTMKYISGARWNDAKIEEYENPFTKELIEVGTAKEDTSQYSDYFDMSKVSDEMLSKPLFVHLDMSKSGDATGICGVYIKEKKPKIEGEDSSKEMFYRIAFSVSVKAPRGYEISFDKNRQFIRWLREQGFNVKGLSADAYQSAQISQQLTADGFDVKPISMDIVDKKSHQNIPYAYFKSSLYDGRVEVYKRCDRLTEEVIGLEREPDGKIEHPEAGKYGSKDAIDAVVGAMYNASQFADQYAYDYGETYETMFDVNEKDHHGEREQVIVDFEQELMSLRHPLTNKEIGNTPEVGKGKVVGGIDKEAQERMRQEYLKRKQQEEENFLISSNYDDSMIVF